MRLDNTSNGKVYNLKDKYNINNFNKLQIIAYFDFLLILKFDDKKNAWNMKVFSIFIEENSYFDLINSIDIKGIDKEAKFSFAEIKEKNIYLY